VIDGGRQTCQKRTGFFFANRLSCGFGLRLWPVAFLEAVSRRQQDAAKVRHPQRRCGLLPFRGGGVSASYVADIAVPAREKEKEEDY
jgi:hypothetical protein